MPLKAELFESFEMGKDKPGLTLYHHFVYGEHEPFDIIHNLPLEGEHGLDSFLAQWLQKADAELFSPDARGFT